MLLMLLPWLGVLKVEEGKGVLFALGGRTVLRCFWQMPGKASTEATTPPPPSTIFVESGGSNFRLYLPGNKQHLLGDDSQRQLAPACEKVAAPHPGPNSLAAHLSPDGRYKRKHCQPIPQNHQTQLSPAHSAPAPAFD